MTKQQWEYLRKLIIEYGNAKVIFMKEASTSYPDRLKNLDTAEKDIEEYVKQFIKDE